MVKRSLGRLLIRGWHWGFWWIRSEELLGNVGHRHTSCLNMQGVSRLFGTPAVLFYGWFFKAQGASQHRSAQFQTTFHFSFLPRISPFWQDQIRHGRIWMRQAELTWRNCQGFTVLHSFTQNPGCTGSLHFRCSYCHLLGFFITNRRTSPLPWPGGGCLYLHRTCSAGAWTHGRVHRSDVGGSPNRDFGMFLGR